MKNQWYKLESLERYIKNELKLNYLLYVSAIMFDDLENILDTIVPDDNDVENDSIVHTDEFT